VEGVKWGSIDPPLDPVLPQSMSVVVHIYSVALALTTKLTTTEAKYTKSHTNRN